MKRTPAVFGVAALAVIGLAACSSNSGSSSSSSSAAASGKNLATICAEADVAITNAIPSTPTKEGVQKAVTQLNTIKATGDAGAQAALTPLITALQGIENVDFSAPTPPPSYEAFTTAATNFKTACAGVNVQLTAKPSASAS